MGAWGFQTFENDDALDWADGLSKTQDSSFVAHAFENVPRDETHPLGVRTACCALAAAEVVAALSSTKVASLPEAVAVWAKTNPVVPPELAEEARRSVRRILVDSALRELWEESGDYEGWYSAVHDLLTRLSAKSAEGLAPSGNEPQPQATNRGNRKRPRAYQSPRSDSVAAAQGTLLDRAVRFLQGIVPFEGYSSETEVEDYIRRYVTGGPWDEPGLQEGMRLCYSVALQEIDGEDFAGYPKAQKAYLHGCRELLREIMLETYGKAEPYSDLG